MMTNSLEIEGRPQDTRVVVAMSGGRVGPARELGAKVLAAGPSVVNRRLADGTRALYRAHGADRDQSYFLFATTRAQLSVVRFPLGDLPKRETRALAHRFGLAVADKQDSQDICF